MATAANASSSCSPMAATSNGVWQGDIPTHFALPLLVIQTCIVLLLTRALGFILKPLKQPRVVAEIIGGVLLGPSALGRIKTFKDNVFPTQSLTVLDTVANLGLLFFLFLVGLELDLHAIKRTGKQALSIAAAGISVPFVAGVGVSAVLHKTISSDTRFPPFLVFMGVAMSITAFPVLARILAERKLLTTDVGQMAMSAAAVNDVIAWILLALAVALSGSASSLVAIWVLLCGAAFVIVMFVVIKPLVSKIVRQTVENEPLNELHVAMTFAGVIVAGLVTDIIGIHPIFGAFVFGLIIPKEGSFAGFLIEKIEDFITTLMLPLYFADSGLKTNIGTIHGARSGGLLVLVIATACLGKIFGTAIVASLFRVRLRKAFTLGFLMNTKGLVELIVLNIGLDRKVLNAETFAIMVLMALCTTFMTTPVVMALYKPARDPVPYTRRTLGMPDKKSDSELRVLACVHGMPNVHAVINLIELSRGIRTRPLRMYVLHMLQLTERPSSIMRVQQVRRDGLPSTSADIHNNMDSVVLAFEAYGRLSRVTVQAMTDISNFDDMHEDICTIASEKRTAIIILPFHKYAMPLSGGWEGHNPGIRGVNQKVLAHASCSVGILVDRGIGMGAISSSNVDQDVAVLFFGGPDDREALAYGYRMAEHPGVKLKVFRFLPGSQVGEGAAPIEQSHSGRYSHGLHDGRHSHGHHDGEASWRHMRLSRTQDTFDVMVTGGYDIAIESKMDEECLAIAKGSNIISASTSSPQAILAEAVPFSVSLEEREVSNPLEAVREIGKSNRFGLLLMGRGRRPSPMIAALAGRPAVFPELGPAGDALACLDVEGFHPSFLVIQQYDPTLAKEEVKRDDHTSTEISFWKTSSIFPDWSVLVATGPRSTSPPHAELADV